MLHRVQVCSPNTCDIVGEVAGEVAGDIVGETTVFKMFHNFTIRFFCTIRLIEYRGKIKTHLTVSYKLTSQVECTYLQIK